MNAMTTVKPDLSSAVEQVLVGGDLSKLSATERVAYYRAVCESVAVNPLSRPFEYIVLNGKLTLYARKDCTDQLRKNSRVSIQIVSKEKMDEVYVVTARATMPDGRADEAVGAVNLAGQRGEALANALMKAETKAKRRVTLSICGLGFADESEIESIPGARAVHVDPATGEMSGFAAAGQLAAAAQSDFGALIMAARNTEELLAVARDIEVARKAGHIDADVRKLLLAQFRAKQESLGAAA